MSTPASGSLVIIGGGLAAVTLARSLRGRGDERSIIMLSAESRAPYDRPPLSKQVLSGEMSPDDAALFMDGELERLGIDLRLAARAVALAPDDLTVTCADGSRVVGESVVIATGASPRRLPAVEGISGVHYLRTLDDSIALRRDLHPDARLVVIGAGFIGLEIAAVARAMGCAVTVLESMDAPLSRVLGDTAGCLIVDAHRDHGVDLRCGVTVAGVTSHDGHVTGVVLSDGTELPADVVVVGIGVTPETQWLDGSGVSVDNGVVCDERGRTSRAGVWAVGDVARWPNAITGLHARVEQWQAALDQAQVVAGDLVGEEIRWESVPYFWSDQYDQKIQFAGHVGAHVEIASDTVAVFAAPDGRATGILVISNPRLLAKGRRAIAAGATLDEVRALL